MTRGAGGGTAGVRAWTCGSGDGSWSEGSGSGRRDSDMGERGKRDAEPGTRRRPTRRRPTRRRPTRRGPTKGGPTKGGPTRGGAQHEPGRESREVRGGDGSAVAGGELPHTAQRGNRPIHRLHHHHTLRGGLAT